MKKKRNFEQKQFAVQRNSGENLQVQKVEIQNKYQGNNNRRRGNFHNKSSRDFNNRASQNFRTNPDTYNVPQDYGHRAITLPDTRVPPPTYLDNNNRPGNFNQNNLN